MELELQEKMNLLADAERMGNMGSWKSDVFMNHMVLSDQLRRMWAFGENEEITKEKMLLRIHADDREDIREKIQEVIEKNAHFTSDYRIVLPDGTMRHISGNIEAACNPQGKPLFIHGTVQDITERKKEEAERARLTEILESSTDLVGISYPDGRGLYMNRAGRLMAGFGLDEDLSRYKSSEMHPAWALRIVEEEGMPEAMAKGSWEGETAIVTRDGKEIPVFQSIMVHRNSGGEIDCISTIMHDITERKRAEKAFQENLSLLAEAERIGQIGSWETDVNMNPVKLSSGLRRIWGFPEGRNVSGDELVSRIHPDDRENMLRGWRASIDQGTSSSHEYRIVLPDGTLRHVFATSEVIFDAQGKAAGVHGVVQDITQRKRLEDEMINAQKLESIGTLAGGLAHDFNNLLATIMGSLEVAKMDMDETDRPYAMLTKAEQAVLTARDLTRQLLTFSRGGHPISVVMTINQLLADTVRLALKGSVTQLEWKVAENLPEINIDENQIIQVTHNIVLNAREAMSQAGKLTIKADEVTIDRDNALKLKEGTYVRLVFRDEGKGIRAEHVPKLFEPYFSTKEMGNKKGMGLGLAVCYSIMKRHQGYIQVDSREGAGTDVSLYFPAAVKRHS